MKKNSGLTKDEFLRLRIDKEEKRRLDLLSKLTRRQKSDLVRESLFELYKNKYPDCLIS
jgi:predicted DNA-binding protein